MLKNKDTKPIFYNSAADMDKPLRVLIEELRSGVSHIRGKISDIRRSYGFNDHLEHLEGGLTCMLVAMYATRNMFIEFENKHHKTEEKPT